jgi:hypothetical protein
MTICLTSDFTEVVLSLAFVRILLPRDGAPERPFDISASEVDMLMEFKPEGKVRQTRSYLIKISPLVRVKLS